jgi:epoxyqueuosine reductase
MEYPNLSLVVKSIAHQFGFVDAGITLLQRPDHFGTYLSWLSGGHAEGMTYLKREDAIAARENPRLLLPECQSIIVLMARYSTPLVSEEPTTASCFGKVAAYARGEDYHTVLNEKLEGIAAELTSIVDTPVSYCGFTDSGPLLERELAFNAGLGWIGRNSCLISPQYGSFTFLAELLTDLPLVPQGVTLDDRCGNCHRCIDACPTQCILSNRTIAAERCLSYLTIENRGEIPRELRSSLSDCIFGCDICQVVCPWNRRVDNSEVDPRFFPTKHIRALDLVKEIQLTEGEFKQTFQNSPVLRAKRSGYLRNIALVIGNHPTSRSKEILLDILRKEEEPLIRAAAAWAIGQIPDRSIMRELLVIQKLEDDKMVCREISHVLEGEK